MRFSGWNPFLALGRLGVKAPVQPQLSETIVPVALFGDYTRSLPRLDTADGIDGFGAAVVAGNVRGYQLMPRSSGGLLIHHFCMNHPGGAGAVDDWRFVWGIGPFNPAFPPATAIGNSINPRRPCTSLRNVYLQPASYLIGVTTRDQVFLGGNFFTTKMPQFQFMGPIWVPPGQTFIIEGFLQNIGLQGHVYFTELEAPLPTE